MSYAPKIYPLGDNALTITFGNEISITLNDRAIALAERLSREQFPGFIEAAPAYSSVTVFYDPAEVRRQMSDHDTAYLAITSVVERLLTETGGHENADDRLIEIVCDFGARSALDVDFICEYSGLDRETVIEVFISRTYRVFMLGFLPGFTYMGEVDERIAVPRRPSPRKAVPLGSVGIAGKQTGIYPFESPGGWQIIGRTDVGLFSRDADPPCLLRPGDSVRFVPR